MHRSVPSNRKPVIVSADGSGVPKSADEITSYESALAYLLERANVEATHAAQVDPRAFKLERTEAIMEALGNPHRCFKSVHVAGSKGKGSVCEMLASSLQACGLTTGLYTSPHLIDARERVRLNGSKIPETDFTRLTKQVAAVVPGIRKKWGEPTFFELFTAVGFLYFAEQAIDIAVIEVGLGGRLDSTNVITPEVSIITAIQLEHTQLLGTTLEKIAGEKAGIIKERVPLLTIPQDESVMKVFRGVAGAVGAPMQVLGEDLDFSFRFESSPELGKHLKVCVGTTRVPFEHIAVPLKGEHQARNCGLVLAALDVLKGRGFPIREREAAAGLAKTPDHGRLELVHGSPRVIVDGAHNPESIKELMRSLGAHMSYGSLVVIFGCAKDKNIPAMLANIAGGADKVIFTRASGNKRAADPRELLRKYGEVGHASMAQAASSVREAIAMAKQAVSRGDLVCATGSFYIAGEVKSLLQTQREA